MPAWITSALAAVVNLPSVIAAGINAWMERDKENNTPAMQDNAQAKQDEADSEQLTRDIAKAHAGDPKPLEDDEA